MAEFMRAQFSCRGFTSYLKKLLANVDKLLANTHPLSKDSIASLRDLQQQLQWKQERIAPLNAQILTATEDEEDIKSKLKRPI